MRHEVIVMLIARIKKIDARTAQPVGLIKAMSLYCFTIAFLFD